LLLLLAPAGLWLLVLLILPTVLLLILSLMPGYRPGNPVNSWGLVNYLRTVDPLYLSVLLRSLGFALGSTLLCLLLGFPVAYWLALKARRRWRGILLTAFILPLWTSSLLRAYAWITILRPSGLLNTLLESVGLPRLMLLNQPVAVLIGMTYSFLPGMVLILYAALDRLDHRLLEAAADLGATPRQTFWQITLPQVRTGMIAGALVVFISGLGDFVSPELLGGASSMTVSRLIYNQFLGASRNWGFGSALSMLLILGVSSAIALLLRYSGEKNAGDGNRALMQNLLATGK
jgi:spermidine/putrescine transport system permease protein